MDLVESLPAALGNLRYAVVTVEYFTKWIEAKALVIIALELISPAYQSWYNIFLLTTKQH
jgi:hypothetical protein